MNGGGSPCARAIVGEPAILLAERTDPQPQSLRGAGVLAILANLNKRGVTMLVVTHGIAAARASSGCGRRH